MEIWYLIVISMVSLGASGKTNKPNVKGDHQPSDFHLIHIFPHGHHMQQTPRTLQLHLHVTSNGFKITCYALITFFFFFLCFFHVVFSMLFFHGSHRNG